MPFADQPDTDIVPEPDLVSVVPLVNPMALGEVNVLPESTFTTLFDETQKPRLLPRTTSPCTCNCELWRANPFSLNVAGLPPMFSDDET